MVNHEDIFSRCEKYSSKLDISRSFICIFVAMTENEKLALQERIIEALKTVYDPEIPVNIYDLGLIYRIELTDDARAEVDMTLTAPNCPAADFIMEDVRMRVEGITGITSATINLVFEPEWDKDMMSEEAKLELGFM
jgi:FeS assembly SUF system protein